MIEFTAYHGTSEDSCRRVLDGGWQPSIGIRHWLGDGIYFFENEQDAWDWARRSGNGAVLEADVSVEDARMFDLTKQECLDIYIEQAHLVLRKASELGLLIDRKHKIDGFVINLICDKFYQYHVIKRKFYFTMKEFAEYQQKYRSSVTRFMDEQIQYCVREPKCIVGTRKRGSHD